MANDKGSFKEPLCFKIAGKIMAQHRHSLCTSILKIIMAEIHVQAKRRSSSAWLWILISIIILGTIAFILLWNNNAEVREKFTKPTQTSMIQNTFDETTG